MTQLSAFYKTYVDMFETISECLIKGRTTPALVLLYAGIDSFSELSNKGNQTGKTVFKEWVKKWMLNKYPLPCNEIDLYAARCGLLHLQKSESKLSKDGTARELWYSWGNGEVSRLQFGIDSLGKKIIAIKVEDIFESFKNGMYDCLQAIENEAEWNQIFEEKSASLFKNIDHSSII